MEQVEKLFEICKVDIERRQVFGWASVIEENGEPVEDSQGDVISEVDLEKASYHFAVNSREAGAMHERKGIGKMIASIVFTKAIQKALGIDLKKVGWFVGFQIDDPDEWEKVKNGTYKMLSIGGKGIRKPRKPVVA